MQQAPKRCETPSLPSLPLNPLSLTRLYRVSVSSDQRSSSSSSLFGTKSHVACVVLLGIAVYAVQFLWLAGELRGTFLGKVTQIRDLPFEAGAAEVKDKCETMVGPHGMEDLQVKKRFFGQNCLF